MEIIEICDAPEPNAFIEYEMSCPFCEENMLGIVIEGGSAYYKCGSCGNMWTVLGG